MTEPDWAILLDTMYETSGTLVHRAPEGEDYEYEMYHPLAKDVDLDPDERRRELEYMEEVGLIEEFQDEGWFRPSQLGVQIAHDRQKARRQEKTNAALVILTLALVLVGAVGNLPNNWVMIGGNLLILLFLAWVVHQEEIMPDLLR